MRIDKQKRHAQFANLIQAIIDQGDPANVRDFEDFRWASLSQAEWHSQLGFSVRTLRGLAKILPIVSTATVDPQNKPVVFYRLGTEPHATARTVVNGMANAFKKKYGRAPTRHAVGCLRGLANVWPAGCQGEIFKTVLEDFEAFMAGVRVTDPDSKHFIRYYEYVPIPLVRKHHRVALDLYVMKLQELNLPPPASLAAVCPGLFPKLDTISAKKCQPKKQMMAGNSPKPSTPELLL